LFARGTSLLTGYYGLSAPVYPMNINSDNCTDTIITVTNQGYPSSYYMPSGCSGAGGGQGPMVSGQSNSVAIDWNGDGIQEPVYYGIDGENTPGWIALIPITFAGISGMARLPVSTAMAPTTTQIFAADINGDGLQDLVWVDPSTSTLRYQLHAGVQPELMTTVTDGYGNATSFNYQPTSSGNCTTANDGTIPPLNTGLRRSLTTHYVVCGLTTNDGIGGNYTLSYGYSNPTDNVQGRGYVGFERRTVTDSRTGTAHQENYYQTFPHIGMVAYALDTQSNGKKIRETTVSVDKVVTGTGYNATYFPYVSASTVDAYEVSLGQSADGLITTRQTTTVNAIDSFGNVTNVSVATIDKDAFSSRTGQGSANGDSTTVQTIATISNDNSLSNWCLGRPSQVQTTTTLPDSTLQVRTNTAIMDYAMCRANKEFSVVDYTPLRIETDYTYDDLDANYTHPKCGNLSQVTVIGTSAGGGALTGRTVKFDYGTACRLPETITDPLGNSSARTYRYDLGLLASVTDANGLVTSYSYDNFGRTQVATNPDGTSTATTYAACNQSNSYCGVAGLRMQLQSTERDTNGGAITSSYAFSDGFDRARFVKSTLPGGALSIVETTYDNLGRVASRSVPYTSALNGKTVYGYDLIGRQKSAQLLNSLGSLVRGSSIVYSGRTQIFTDPRTFSTTKLFDAAGQLRKVTDPIVTGSSLSGATRFDYTFEANGVLKATVTDAAGNLLVTRSNMRGYKNQTVDPDMGTWNYQYDSLGELTQQDDPNGRAQHPSTPTVAYGAYDPLGRPTTRTEPEGTTTWTWGTATDNANSPPGKYIGQLKSVSGPGYSESYTYDQFSRPSQTTVNSDAAYLINYAYRPTTGLLDTVTYPASTGARLAVKYDYQYGIQTKATDYTTGSAGTVFWQLNATDAMGHLTDESLGNGGRVLSGFDPTTGVMTTRQSGTAGSTTNKQNLAYLWDASGNLTQRTDNNQSGLHENFYYDQMNRLDYSQLNGTTNLDVTVNAIGNLTYKSDVGNYTYPASGGGSVRPHAVTTAGSGSYVYDNNGNMTTRTGSTISWTSYNMPSTINGSGQSSTFSYAPDRSRFKQVATYATGNETTYYIGGVMEKLVLSGGVTAYRHYIGAGSNTIVHTRWSNGTPSQTFYVTTDHLGSSSAITDQSGALVVNESFAAYGARRGSNWAGAPSSGDMTAIANTTRHGYTGHEHLDNLGLINMNGRVQDPVLGRFISADPLIDGTFGTQGLNRYAYVGNRPLSFTDPSGFLGTPDMTEIVVTGNSTSGLTEIVVTGSNTIQGTTTIDGREMSVSIQIISVTASDPLIQRIRDNDEVLRKIREDAERTARDVEEMKELLKPLRLPPPVRVPSWWRRLFNFGSTVAMILPPVAVEDILGTAALKAAAEKAAAEKLAKQLASEEGVAELLSGGGKAVAGAGTDVPIRDIGRIVSEHGGNPGDWAKVSSTAPGHFETHAYRNVLTGEVVEFKSIVQ